MIPEEPRHHDYWNSFYHDGRSGAVPENPSDFARWVQGELPHKHGVVELGFGNGRDSLWFAEQGRDVLAFDFAESAIRLARSRATDQRLTASFALLDLYDRNAVEVAAKEILGGVAAPTIYARFLIHSLEDAGRANLLDLAVATLPGHGDLYLEFRTGQDSASRHLFGDDHFRRFLDPATVIAEIEERGGRVTYSVTGHGMAVYKTEDPHVARVVANWPAESGRRR